MPYSRVSSDRDAPSHPTGMRPGPPRACAGLELGGPLGARFDPGDRCEDGSQSFFTLTTVQGWWPAWSRACSSSPEWPDPGAYRRLAGGARPASVAASRAGQPGGDPGRPCAHVAVARARDPRSGPAVGGSVMLLTWLVALSVIMPGGPAIGAALHEHRMQSMTAEAARNESESANQEAVRPQHVRAPRAGCHRARTTTQPVTMAVHASDGGPPLTRLG